MPSHQLMHLVCLPPYNRLPNTRKHALPSPLAMPLPPPFALLLHNPTRPISTPHFPFLHPSKTLLHVPFPASP